MSYTMKYKLFWSVIIVLLSSGKPAIRYIEFYAKILCFQHIDLDMYQFLQVFVMEQASLQPTFFKEQPEKT